ncbi:uncharacterized protein TNCT_639551, partial [Trichonephila clavata]
KEYFFDGQEMAHVICVPHPTGIYTGQIYERSFMGKEKGQCDKDGGIIEFFIVLKEEVLEGFRLFCKKIKDDDVESGSMTKSSALGGKAVCGDNYVIAGFEVKLEKKPHLLNVICQKHKPAGLGSDLLGAGTVCHSTGAGTVCHSPGAGTVCHSPGAGTVCHSPGAGTVCHSPGAGTVCHSPGAGTVSHSPDAGIICHFSGAGTMCHFPGVGTVCQGRKKVVCRRTPDHL